MKIDYDSVNQFSVQSSISFLKIWFLSIFKTEYELISNAIDANVHFVIKTQTKKKPKSIIRNTIAKTVAVCIQILGHGV